jgi:aerobic C4-dicarboxylate transport protein
MSKAVSPAARRPWHSILYVRVLLGIALAILLGYLQPDLAIQMKPLGDAFIKLIKMAIGLVIFFTVVSGIGAMQSMKSVGASAARPLIYFEVVSTLALVIGMLIGNWLAPGRASMPIPPSSMRRRSGNLRARRRSRASPTSS